jgi:hypothetical protein
VQKLNLDRTLHPWSPTREFAVSMNGIKERYSTCRNSVRKGCPRRQDIRLTNVVYDAGRIQPTFPPKQCRVSQSSN